MFERNDLRTRGVETWVQAQKVEKDMSDEEARHKKETEKVKNRVETRSQAQEVLEKEMSDEEASHKEETEKVKEDRKKGRKEKLRKLRKKLGKAQKAQIDQLLHAREITRKVQIQAVVCIRLTRALRVKKKNVGLKLLQFQYKDGVSNLPQGLDKKLLKTGFVRCIEPNGKHTAIKHQEVVFNEEVEVKEVEQISFTAQETIEKEDEERSKEKEVTEKELLDKDIAEAKQICKQIADIGYSIPGPMRCIPLIRGLNLTETEVHSIASKLSIKAVDREEQAVEIIKALMDTNRVLTEVFKPKEIKEEETVNLVEEVNGLLFLCSDKHTICSPLAGNICFAGSKRGACFILKSFAQPYNDNYGQINVPEVERRL